MGANPCAKPAQAPNPLEPCQTSLDMSLLQWIPHAALLRRPTNSAMRLKGVIGDGKQDSIVGRCAATAIHMRCRVCTTSLKWYPHYLYRPCISPPTHLVRANPHACALDACPPPPLCLLPPPPAPDLAQLCPPHPHPLQEPLFVTGLGWHSQSHMEVSLQACVELGTQQHRHTTNHLHPSAQNKNRMKITTAKIVGYPLPGNLETSIEKAH